MEKEIYRRPVREQSSWTLIGERGFRDRASNKWRTMAAMMIALGILRRNGYVRTDKYEYTTIPS
jgi:hypothetical protein